MIARMMRVILRRWNRVHVYDSLFAAPLPCCPAVQSQLEDAGSTISTLQSRVAARDSTISDLQSRLAASNETCTELRSVMDKLRERERQRESRFLCICDGDHGPWARHPLCRAASNLLSLFRHRFFRVPQPIPSSPPSGAVRDALAEAKGCIRVVVRVKPLLPVDIAAAARDGVLAHTLRWLLQQYAARRVPRRDSMYDFDDESAPSALDALVRWLGWGGSFDQLLSLVGRGGDASAVAGRLTSPSAGMSCDAGPLCVRIGLNSDATKDVVAVPPVLDATAVLTQLDALGVTAAAAIAADGGLAGPHGRWKAGAADATTASAGCADGEAQRVPPAVEALLQSLCVPRSLTNTPCFEFDKVLPTSAGQEEVFDGASRKASSQRYAAAVPDNGMLADGRPLLCSDVA